MWIDLSPLRKNKRFRILFIGQAISAVGFHLTHVALPYQIFQLTKSSLAVGSMGLVQFFPLVLSGLLGGTVADAVDRRKLILSTYAFGIALLALLAWNGYQAEPKLWILYAVGAGFGLMMGFHRPALEAITQQIVPTEQMAAVSAIQSMRSTFAMIIGPAIAGFVIAHFGVGAVFALDALGLVVALAAIAALGALPRIDKRSSVSLTSLFEGFRYALSRQELMGTYLIDFIAMIFGMPMALFPAISEGFGGAKVVGLFYSAPAVGAFLCSLTSRWTLRVRRHGAAISIAAFFWGVGIIGFGLASNLWLALACLAFAGAGDMVSGIFRSTVWNQTIPKHMRGRMAGIEMISYMSGPILGDAESGFVAAATSVRFSVVSGGVLCIAGVVALAYALPKFWKYEAAEHPSSS